MDYDKIVEFLAKQWPSIVAMVIIITPVVWLILHFLYKHRLEGLREDRERLERENRSLKEDLDAFRTFGKSAEFSADRNATSPDRVESKVQASLLAVPIYRLRVDDGFEGGDDAALSLVIQSLQCFEAGIAKPYILELPEIEENRSRIAALKALSQRGERESRELVQRIDSDQKNIEILTVLEFCFDIILTNSKFRQSGDLKLSPTYS